MCKVIRVILNTMFIFVSLTSTAAEVSATCSDGVVTIDGSYTVAASEQQVIAGLTDFGRMASYMPGLKTSAVVEQSNGKIIVRQTGTAKIGIFSSNWDRQIEVTANGNTLVSKTVKTEDGDMVSTTTVTTNGTQSVVSYHAVWTPSNSLVCSVGMGKVRSNTAASMEAAKIEITRRAGTQVAGI